MKGFPVAKVYAEISRQSQLVCQIGKQCLEERVDGGDAETVIIVQNASQSYSGTFPKHIGGYVRQLFANLFKQFFARFQTVRHTIEML